MWGMHRLAKRYHFHRAPTAQQRATADRMHLIEQITTFRFADKEACCRAQTWCTHSCIEDIQGLEFLNRFDFALSTYSCRSKSELGLSRARPTKVMSAPSQSVVRKRQKAEYYRRHKGETVLKERHAAQQREYRRRQRVASDLANDKIAHSADRVRSVRRESSAYASTITNKYNALPVLAGSRFGKQLYACL